MPTYQYSCTECGHFFEQVQSFTEDSLTVCPECDGRLRKVFNAVGVVFKGSGFYRTDSRGGSSGSDTPTKTSTGSGGDTSTSSDAGSTPSDKAAAKPSGSSAAGAGVG